MCCPNPDNGYLDCCDPPPLVVRVALALDGVDEVALLDDVDAFRAAIAALLDVPVEYVEVEGAEAQEEPPEGASRQRRLEHGTIVVTFTVAMGEAPAILAAGPPFTIADALARVEAALGDSVAVVNAMDAAGLTAVNDAAFESATTMEPTTSPSSWPTTESPTAYPNPGGTHFPVVEPTSYPTTREPTAYPVTVPTLWPTRSPTRSPTAYPLPGGTNYPVTVPTKFPTPREPTQFPVVEPTKYPTTRQPTSFPFSLFPTRSPTRRPTSFPLPGGTKYPLPGNSKYPSRFPSAFPTDKPTRFPTNFPVSSRRLGQRPAAAEVEAEAEEIDRRRLDKDEASSSARLDSGAMIVLVVSVLGVLFNR